MFRVAQPSSSGALIVFAASGLHTPVPTQTSLRPVTTCVYKPEAANRVKAPDD
jgi:hypothetical protein